MARVGRERPSTQAARRLSLNRLPRTIYNGRMCWAFASLSGQEDPTRPEHVLLEGTGAWTPTVVGSGGGALAQLYLCANWSAFRSPPSRSTKGNSGWDLEPNYGTTFPTKMFLQKRLKMCLKEHLMAVFDFPRSPCFRFFFTIRMMFKHKPCLFSHIHSNTSTLLHLYFPSFLFVKYSHCFYLSYLVKFFLYKLWIFLLTYFVISSPVNVNVPLVGLIK